MAGLVGEEFNNLPPEVQAAMRKVGAGHMGDPNDPNLIGYNEHGFPMYKERFPQK